MSTEAGLTPPEPPKRPADPSEDGRDWHDVASLLVWGATLLAAVAAAVFTGRQAYLANKQLRVARDALGVTQDTEKRQLRAYVTVLGSYVQFVVAHPVTFTDTVRNFGVTPAYHFGIKGFGGILPRPEIPIFPIVDYRNQQIQNSVTVYPGQNHDFTTAELRDKPLITEDQRRSVEEGASVIVNYGTLYYDDAFAQHWKTDFCFFYEWADIPISRWHECINHQGADEDAENDLPK